MRVLVIQGHPDSQSYIAALAAGYIEQVKEAGHEVRVIDLATAQFDPVLRYGYRERMEPDPFIEKSQEDVLWAEHLSVFFPVWWAAEPSVLKGWFDRVFTPKVTYTYRPGKASPVKLLKGRTASVIVASHAPDFFVKLNPSYPIRRMRRNVLGYCGVKVKENYVFGGIGGPNETPENLEKFKAKVLAAGRKLK